MNFYKRFIGDITAKTGGLSLARMGAYDRLLDHFYSTELPIAPEEVYSICRAMTRADRCDVDAVLARFWDMTPAGYVQTKAEEVIAKARPLIEAARANGKKGGRPKKQNPEETQPVSKNNPEETQDEPSSKATQSQSQIPSLRSGERRASRLPLPFALPPEYREFCVTERPDLDPDRVAAKFADHWHSKAGAQGRKLDWLATWRNWVRDERSALRSTDVSRVTVPGPVGPDPALEKIKADAKLAAPIPQSERERWAKLKEAH